MNDAPAKRRIDQAEHGLSHWVDVFLDRAMTGPCWYTAVDTGTYRPGASREQRMAIENKRRAMGIKPHHLDWYVWQKSTGQFTQFELKVAGNSTTPGQEQTIEALQRNHIPTTVCETVPQVFEFLREAGFVLHSNAKNIAAELHERYLAQRREKVGPVKSRTTRLRVAPRATASRGFQKRAAARGVLIP